MLGGGTETAEYIDVNRESTKTGNGSLVMLLGKHCCGHENCHLLAIHNRLHNATQSDLGFAEPHIAAQESVHGNGSFHIPLDFCNTTQLVVSFRIGEIVFKFPLPRRISAESKTLLPPAGGIELNQLRGHILGGRTCLCFGLVPCVCTNFVQTNIGILSTAANILADQVQLRGRYKQGVSSLISNLNIVFNSVVDFDLFHSYKSTDTVVFMNDQIAGG